MEGARCEAGRARAAGAGRGMRRWRWRAAGVLGVMLLAGVWQVPLGASAAGRPEAPSIVHFDLTPLLKLELADEAQRRRFWDECHLVFALQGIVNREGPRLFVRWIGSADDFWWGEMTGAGGWLEGRVVERVATTEELLARFAREVRGVVVWDERVPATSNLASTVAGCEDLLPVRWDAGEGSWCQRLIRGEGARPVRVRLLGEDGGSLFTGRGTIPGTGLASTGSAKGDAYRWLVERYVRTGKANPRRMGYYLDGHWLRSWRAAGPEHHTLSNHDYVIAHRGVLFDLGVWEDEGCVDEPGQAPGTDVMVLKELLRAAYDRLEGAAMIHVAGFVPWAYKYTNHRGGHWGAGGRHEPVPTEWRYAEILSCFNAYMDADALGLGAMANASFFQHYPLAARYEQNPAPTRASLEAAGILDGSGRVVPRGYVAHYVGDYDAAAWLYRELPRLWRDPARGQTPLAWAFNPNLADRFPLGMAWARARRTTNDFFVAGDSGAGYLNPGYLTPPRRHSGLGSGMAVWERHCEGYYRQWDLTVTGFVIDGYAPGLSGEGLDAYARFSPGGIVAQKVPARGLHAGMPILRMRSDVDGPPREVARTLHSLAGGSPPRFVAVRSILKSPTWYAEVSRELGQLAGDTVRVVDLRTLLWLVRAVEADPGQVAPSRFAGGTQVSARPGGLAGLAPVRVQDGPFEEGEREGERCWRLGASQPGHYLYFDVDDGFARAVGRRVEISVEFLDEGRGRLELHYDSFDPGAPVEGAYKAQGVAGARTGQGGWRRVDFRVDDARLAGRQNGECDFRFYNGGDDWWVREVRVRVWGEGGGDE